MVACAIEGTVSVSTVMLFRESLRDLIVESDEKDGFEGRVFGRCVVEDRCSCILPLSFLRPLSLPLSACLADFALRSSVTFDDVTSCLSSSEDLWSDAEGGRL